MFPSSLFKPCMLISPSSLFKPNNVCSFDDGRGVWACSTRLRTNPREGWTVIWELIKKNEMSPQMNVGPWECKLGYNKIDDLELSDGLRYTWNQIVFIKLSSTKSREILLCQNRWFFWKVSDSLWQTHHPSIWKTDCGILPSFHGQTQSIDNKKHVENSASIPFSEKSCVLAANCSSKTFVPRC